MVSVTIELREAIGAIRDAFCRLLFPLANWLTQAPKAGLSGPGVCREPGGPLTRSRLRASMSEVLHVALPCGRLVGLDVALRRGVLGALGRTLRLKASKTLGEAWRRAQCGRAYALGRVAVSTVPKSEVGGTVAGSFLADLAPMLDVDLGETRPTATGRPLETTLSAVAGLAGFERASRPAESLNDCGRLISRTLDLMRLTEPLVGAWAFVDEQAAVRQARDLDLELARSGSRGPLHGLPVGVKDLIHVRGMPTAAGSPSLGQGTEPERQDAPCVRALRDAGAVVLGKTTTHEYAFGGTTPPTRNPWDLARIPGGSSGGSAAAVAAGHVSLAVGTDTGGSVRIPASYCGTVGFVPTPGYFPLDGVVPLAWSLDRVGLLTPTARAMRRAWSALFSTDAAGLDSEPLGGLRVGVPAFAFVEPMDVAVRNAVLTSLALLRQAGAEVIPVELSLGAHAVAAGMTMILAESGEYHRPRLAPGSRHEFGHDVRASLTLAETVPATAYVRAQRVRAQMTQELLALLQTVDILAFPSMPCTAPTWEQASSGVIQIGACKVPLAEAHLRNNVAFNLAGLPCATQPCGNDERGLPIGLGWATAPGRDQLLLSVMCAFENMRPPAQPAFIGHDAS